MTAGNITATSSGWAIVGQTPGTQVTPDGRVQDGYTVTFRTGNGVTGTVFVPTVQYNVETVQALVTAHAMQLDAVAGLSAPAS